MQLNISQQFLPSRIFIKRQHLRNKDKVRNTVTTHATCLIIQCYNISNYVNQFVATSTVLQPQPNATNINQNSMQKFYHQLYRSITRIMTATIYTIINVWFQIVYFVLKYSLTLDFLLHNHPTINQRVLSSNTMLLFNSILIESLKIEIKSNIIYYIPSTRAPICS